MKASRNMNRIDQIVRVFIGIACIFIGFFDRNIISDPVYGILIGLFGVINLGAAVAAVCPIYMLAGLSTYKKKQAK